MPRAITTSTEASIALAKRAAAPPGFRWVPGMREAESGAICCKVLDGEPWLWFVDDDSLTEHEGGAAWPDMGDEGTQGHYFAQVREAWGNAHVVECVDGLFSVGHWKRRDPRSHSSLTYAAEDRPTLGDALVVALEAAPARS